VQRWLAERQPDVLFFIYNDHVSSFFFDHYAAFSLGVGERHEVADEGGGARDLPALAGHPALAQHIGRSLVADEFDMSFFQDRALDHGVFSPMSLLCPARAGLADTGGAAAGRRAAVARAFGAALLPARAGAAPRDRELSGRPEGGHRRHRRLSHQVHGERAGFNNTAWDAQFLDLIENDPVRLTEMTQAELATLGGMEGAEVIMWLVMRGALSSNVRKTHQSYYLPSMTGIATAIYENLASPPVAGEVARHRRHVNEQLAGVEALQGSYPFTLEISVRAYRLNKFLHGMTHPEHRTRFLADEEAAFEAARLTPQERTLVRSRDWRGLIHYGVIFFMLEKLGAVVGVSNLHIYAAMRGQSLEEFQQTRNAPGALYSVAGKDAAPQTWDQPSHQPVNR
jgi:gallate dioxygenase